MKENNLYLDSDALNELTYDSFKRAVTTLELDKVLSILSSYASIDGAKSRIASLRPSVSYEMIVNMQKEVTEAKAYLDVKGAPSFGSAKDITEYMAMASKGAMLSMQALLEIASVLTSVMSLSSYLTLGEKYPLLDSYRQRLLPNKYLRDRITAAIIAEDMMADSASQKLLGIRQSIKNASNKIRDILQKYTSGSESKYLQENIVTIRNGRYVVPVKNEYKNEIKGLVHDTSASGSTVFIEPMQIVEANNRLRTLEAEEKAEMERILYELSAECDKFSHEIISSYNTLCDIAVIFAKAEMSLATSSCEPVINKNKYINLINARHPLLDKDKAVPISVYLGKNFTTLVITGPNTGGKTVTLKTIGLLSMMAQTGLHIPCDDGSTIPVFDSILADIGDEQSIEQSLSTFSAHMVNIVEILRNFTPNSLILFDELGAGTDPLEGAALAQSILEKVTSCKCLCAATTHYSELKAYALDTPGVSNASCEFDIQTLRPTYKLIIGLPGRSNAFAIASRLGISKDIIDASKAKLGGEARSFEGIIRKLEKQRLELEGKRENADKKLAQAEKMYAEAEKMRRDFNERMERESSSAEKKASELLERARSSADYVFDQLQEIQRKKDSEDFKNELEKTRENVRKSLGYASKDSKIANKIESEYIPPREYVVGDNVQLSDLGKSGQIVNIDGENVTVAIGSAKIKTKKNKLRLIEEKEQKPQKKAPPRAPDKALDAKFELDIRGMIGDDAILVIDKFLDDAVIATLPSVRIIHGKGTGALRKAVWEFLRHDKRVASFRPGTFGEGDSGVTVVAMK